MHKTTRIKHALMTIVIAFSAMTGIAVITASNASAATGCSMTNHCYAQAQSGGLGGHQTIHPTCLNAPMGQFATQETWVAGTKGQWVEAGAIVQNHTYIQGQSSKTGRWLFWAQNTSSAFSMHYIEGVAQYGTALTYDVMVHRSSLTKYTINLNYSQTNRHHAYTIANTMTQTGTHWGSESTSAGSHTLFMADGIRTATGLTTWTSGMSGSPSAGFTPGSPQTYAWLNGSTSYKAGIPC